jgi:hypothetical protein
MFDELVKRPITGLLTVAGAVLLAPVLLPAVARITRPMAKAVLRLYFGLVHDVHEEMTEYQLYRRCKIKPGALATGALSEGVQGLLVEEVETEAEESAAEAIIEALGEVL